MITPIVKPQETAKDACISYRKYLTKLSSKPDKSQEEIRKIEKLRLLIEECDKKSIEREIPSPKRRKKGKKERPMWCFPIPLPRRKAKRTEREVPLMDEMTELESTGALISPVDQDERPKAEPAAAPKRFLNWRIR